MSEPEEKEEEQASVEEGAEPPLEEEAEHLEKEEAAESEEEEKEEETAPAAAVEEGEKEEEEIEVVEEKIYSIPLRHVWITPRGKRAPRAVRLVRDFVTRHMKADEVKLSNEINEAIWERSINKPPRLIRVRAVKDKEGKVIVYPASA